MNILNSSVLQTAQDRLIYEDPPVPSAGTARSTRGSSLGPGNLQRTVTIGTSNYITPTESESGFENRRTGGVGGRVLPKRHSTISTVVGLGSSMSSRNLSNNSNNNINKKNSNNNIHQSSQPSLHGILQQIQVSSPIMKMKKFFRNPSMRGLYKVCTSFLYDL